jgi:hypothetical protein
MPCKAIGTALVVLLLPYVFADASGAEMNIGWNIGWIQPLFARSTREPPMWARSAAGDGHDVCLELPVRPVTPGKTCRVIHVHGWGSTGSTYLHNMLLNLAPKGVRVGKDHSLEAATWDACTVVPVRDILP